VRKASRSATAAVAWWNTPEAAGLFNLNSAGGNGREKAQKAQNNRVREDSAPLPSLPAGMHNADLTW
jgi:hypothetical protein